MPENMPDDEDEIDDGAGFDDAGQTVPLSLFTPEQRCSCREIFIDHLHDIGLTDIEIDEFINFAHNPEKEIAK